MGQNLVLSDLRLAAPEWTDIPSPLPHWTSHLPPRHVHVVPSLNLGGAERIVVDLVHSFSQQGIEADVAVMRPSDPAHPVRTSRVGVHRLGKLSWPERIAVVAGLAKASRLPAFCHLTSEDELRKLWSHEVRTVPVVHNVRSGWRVDPAVFEGSPFVPFVAACGDLVARELEAAGLTKPIRVLRHVVPAPCPMSDDSRVATRLRLGAEARTLLIGMTGRFAVQKRYTRAVRILSVLRRDGIDARLAVAGAAPGDEGARCLEAARDEARALRVLDAVEFVGPVGDASRMVGAYDVFLNTSLFEGVSVSCMEAVAAGVPVVTGDVGGQREAVSVHDTLMHEDADDRDWASAILEARSRRREAPCCSDSVRAAAAAAWPWTLTLGPGSMPRTSDERCDVLFVTGNMDVGGAQRSLCNLVAELPARGMRAVVAVAGPVGVPGFMTRARAVGVEFFDLSGHGRTGGLNRRAGRILALVRDKAPRALCFWNMDAATKMAVAKTMRGGGVRIADASPGPMLYAELDAQADVASLLSTSPDDYVANLDLLVSKYAAGGPAPGRARPVRFAVIPNGVPEPQGFLPDDVGPRPPSDANPALAVVTVGRLTAAKRPELLPLVAVELDRLVHGATLTVVGGTHGTDRDGAWAGMLRRCRGVMPGNLLFAGPDDRTTAFLPRFACFYMVSTDQGCPNASLEAMASGLPVVANPDGGTAEQIEDGVNGRLVADPGDEDAYAARLARALADVLTEPGAARRMGGHGRRIAEGRFTMEAMASSYIRALLGDPTEIR